MKEDRTEKRAYIQTVPACFIIKNSLISVLGKKKAAKFVIVIATELQSAACIKRFPSIPHYFALSPKKVWKFAAPPCL